RDETPSAMTTCRKRSAARTSEIKRLLRLIAARISNWHGQTITRSNASRNSTTRNAPRFAMRLTDFKVMTFDCYGTLIDWETGMLAALAPLVRRLPRPPSREHVLAPHAPHEHAQEG